VPRGDPATWLVAGAATAGVVISSLAADVVLPVVGSANLLVVCDRLAK